jgi:hypothetical protein
MKNKYITALMALPLLEPLVLGACSSTPPAPGEGFAIYLTLNNIPVSEMHLVKTYYIPPMPYISPDDILSYDKATNVITLTPPAYQKVLALPVPMDGLAFVACVDKKPIYWGAFWLPISSQSFSGVTILLNLADTISNRIQIGLGYPDQSYFQGKDPRSNQVIMAALEKAGKLK